VADHQSLRDYGLMDRRKFITGTAGAVAVTAIPFQGLPEPVVPAAAFKPSGNTLTTIDMVTREALRIAKQHLTFIGTVENPGPKTFRERDLVLSIDELAEKYIDPAIDEMRNA